MSSLIVPIVMLVLTIGGGGAMLVYLDKKKPTNKGDQTSTKTAADFMNVKDIKNQLLYTDSNSIIAFLRIEGISIDLLSKNEKTMLIKQLTSELSEINYPFKFLAISRPIDISTIIHELTELLKDADDKRKELLRHEIKEMSMLALSGEIVERQFYISIWEKDEYDNGADLIKKAKLLAEKFIINGVSAEVISDKEIVRLLNLMSNPSYVHLEDENVDKTVPILEEIL